MFAQTEPSAAQAPWSPDAAQKRKNPGWSGPGFKGKAAWLRGEDSNL
jgi:hypothetical protein